MTKAIETANAIPFRDLVVRESLSVEADPVTQVLGFHALYNVPVAPKPVTDPRFEHMDDKRVSLRLGLITEELSELFAAVGIKVEMIYSVGAEHKKRTFDEAAMKSGHAIQQARLTSRDRNRNGVEVADALGDLIYVIVGFGLELGYDLRDVLAEIHASNLTKADEDGKPILREDGKVLKGPNYVEPDIAAALQFPGSENNA